MASSRLFIWAVCGLCAPWFPMAGAQAEATVIITTADCARLVAHRPAPDVAYRSGVDAHGRPVAPADLDGGIGLELPEDLIIEIEVDLFERFGIPADPANYQSDALIGLVTFENGRFYFNGQPLQNEEEAALAERCQQIGRAGG